jgi:hypothetical protein
MLFSTNIKSESMFRLTKCMLLIFECLVSLLVNRKARGKLVKWLVRVNMLKLLLFIHHIALCTACIAHFDLTSYLCIR